MGRITVGRYRILHPYVGAPIFNEAIREPSLEWINTRPALFQTHYLLVAWMECHLPLEEIALSFQQWIDKFKYEFHLSFVTEAWLNAGGNKELVREPIKAWLKKNWDADKADFLGYLDALRDARHETQYSLEVLSLEIDMSAAVEISRGFMKAVEGLIER
jgi:hypothetical protein